VTKCVTNVDALFLILFVSHQMIFLQQFIILWKWRQYSIYIFNQKI